MEKIKASKILGATKPFFVVRAIVYLIVTLIMLVVGILGALLCIWAASRSGGLAFFLFILIFGGLIGFLRFAKRYVLYMVKAAHIAAITDFIKTGSVPVTEQGYKGVVAFGTERIKNNFGAANVAFAADALIAGATRQIMKWVNRAENLFSFIPGAKSVFAFLNFVLSTALNYIDEAVLSYVFWHDEEKSGLKKACDGLVYYAQSWKGMLKGALKVGVFVWLLRIVAYLIFYGIFSALGSALFTTGGYLFALLLAFVFLYGVETIIVDPYATCIMVNDYHKSIQGMPLKKDLYGTLCKVSGKFRKLFEKTGEPEPNLAFADGPPPSYNASAAPNYSSAQSNAAGGAGGGGQGSSTTGGSFCPNCGAQLGPDVKFCPSCGKAK